MKQNQTSKIKKKKKDTRNPQLFEVTIIRPARAEIPISDGLQLLEKVRVWQYQLIHADQAGAVSVQSSKMQAFLPI